MDAAFVVADVGFGDLVLIAGVAFLMSVIGGLSGFGIGLVLPAFIAPVVGVVSAIPVMAVAMTFANASRIWVYRRALSWPLAGLLLAAALPPALIGSLVYTQLSPATIAGIIGGFLVVSVPLRRTLEHRRFTLGRPGLAAVAAGFGLFAGGMSGTGLFLAAGLMAAGIHGAALIVTDAVVSTAVNLLKVAVFGGYALLTPELVLAGVLIGLCTVPGAFVARLVMDRLPLKMHIWIMEALILGGGVSFLWEAFRA
jgi:uncharacterized membrane protein YfcA